MTNNFHKSVLLKERIELLNIKKDQKYIDATLGGGGHTFNFLEMGVVVLGMNPDLNVLASDLVNNLDERRLYEVFKTYGEEELALPISSSITIQRQIKR